MPTLVGPWINNGRIELDYSVGYNSDHTQAIFTCALYYATQYSCVDNVNSWATSGHLDTQSGSNIAISHGSGGGRTLFRYFVAGYAGTPTINALVAGVQAQGGVNVSATFKPPPGALAPYTNGGYLASGITSNSANVGGFTGYGNGGTLNNTQVQYNTSASTTGATTLTRGSYGTSMTISGLLGAKTYFYRMRVSNNTYGYGPWGPWKSFTTAPDIFVKVAGVWRQATPYVNVGGVWKQADRFVKVNGVWRS